MNDSAVFLSGETRSWSLFGCNGLFTDLHFDFQGDRVFGLIPIGGFAEECIAEQSVSLICRSSK